MIASLIFHGKIAIHQVSLPISSVKPLEMAVVVDGTVASPGVIGFLVTLRPKTNTISVIPLPGSTEVEIADGAGGDARLPLWRAVSAAPPEIVAAAIDRATGFTARDYFFMPVSGLKHIFTALVNDTSTWPATDTVSYSLQALGYPRGRTHPDQELSFLDRLMNTIPQVTPLEAASLVGVAVSSTTNLTQYQLFTLGNYARGDSLTLSTVASLKRSLPTFRRHHG